MTKPKARQHRPPTPSLAEAPAEISRKPDPSGKLGIVVGMLRRPEGATLDELMAATGWQKHSIRGAISGALKKKLGLEVASVKSEAGRCYRLAAVAADAA